MTDFLRELLGLVHPDRLLRDPRADGAGVRVVGRSVPTGQLQDVTDAPPERCHLLRRQGQLSCRILPTMSR